MRGTEGDRVGQREIKRRGEERGGVHSHMCTPHFFSHRIFSILPKKFQLLTRYVDHLALHIDHLARHIDHLALHIDHLARHIDHLRFARIFHLIKVHPTLTNPLYALDKERRGTDQSQKQNENKGTESNRGTKRTKRRHRVLCPNFVYPVLNSSF